MLSVVAATRAIGVRRVKFGDVRAMKRLSTGRIKAYRYDWAHCGKARSACSSRWRGASPQHSGHIRVGAIRSTVPGTTACV